MRSRFSPSSWTIFSEVADSAVHAGLERLAVNAARPHAAASVDDARPAALRVHEARHYHDYAAAGGFSLLTYRLMRMRHASALHVLNSVLAATGNVVSLSRLVAESIYPTRLPNELVEHLGIGVDTAAHLAGWNSADQLLSALTGISMPDDYLASHWELFFTFYTDGLLTDEPLVPTRLAPAASRSRPSSVISTDDLLEHLAVESEFTLLAEHLGPGQAASYCAERRDFPRSMVARTAADLLGLPCPHPVITACAEAALFQVPDPELVGAVTVAYSEFAPGEVFVQLLDRTDPTAALGSTDPEAARQLAIAGLDEIAPWHRILRIRAAQLPPAHRLLGKRDALVRLSQRPFDDGRSRAAILFPLLTITAALRAAATDGHDSEPEDRASAWWTPPLIVTPDGLETFAPLTSDPRDFALFVAGCLAHLVIDELSRSATLIAAYEMVDAVRVSHGDLVVHLVGLYLRPLLGEHLHAYLAREIPLSSTLAT